MVQTSTNETGMHALAGNSQAAVILANVGHMVERGTKMTNTILVVDDDPVQRRLLEAVILKQGHHVLKCESGEEALSLSCPTPLPDISLVILDLVMPGMDGMAVLEKLSANGNAPSVIVQTAKGGIETVVNAMRLGAFDFVVKPVSPDRLTTAMNKAFKLEGHVKTPRKPAVRHKNTLHLQGYRHTPARAMQPIMQMGEKAALSTIPVLIEGESGVGKEMIAKAIHGSSARVATSR